MDRKSRLLSSWILRLIGATSIATVVIGVCAYWYKRYSTKRRIDKKKRDGEPGGSHSQQSGQVNYL
ncbi:hypothetical protein BDB01DRAFT_567441 [Pilobolus umbonatus]|nr:hypothetical protein BDB01DRAFT_567441 [Pilobolus umbonatus]